MNDALERLVATLLHEGYALYPYTPGATKNATPTPFGIVYPPAYAELSASTFDHLRLECVLLGEPDDGLTASVRFLQATGERHEAGERRADLTRAAPRVEFDFDVVCGRAAMRTEPLGDGRTLVRVCVHNTSRPAGAAGFDRARALRHSLLSTHVLVTAPGARFASPLDTGHETASVNTYPILASAADDAVLGAAIVLPDHPELAPESLGDLFDATEIEEALMIHVQVLSDSERAEIAGGDPVVAEMIARAERAAPEELLRLHGRLRMKD